jgi:tight adherence protein B
VNLPAGLLAGSLALAVVLCLRAAVAAGRRSALTSRLVHARPAAGRGDLRSRLADPPPALVRRLSGTGLPFDARQVWGPWLVALALAVPVGLVAGGPGLAVVALVLVVAVPAIGLRGVAGRADRLVEDALPEALEAMARSLRSGASLRQAVDETAAVTTGVLGSDLATVSSDVAQGEVLADALDRWGGRRPLPGVRLAVSALALGAETGGAHARAIDGVAATLRSRLGVVREVRALSSQARLSGVVITLAPLAFSALAAATDERTAGFLLRTPLGLFCLGAGLALDAVAALWMMRLSRIDA